MKYFLDTEFHEEPGRVDLISLGIISERGDEWYGITGWNDLDRCNDWVKAHVLPHLLNPEARAELTAVFETRDLMKHSLLAYFGADKPEFHGYYSDYDWVAFCQVFGRMIDLPKGWPMYCHDLKQTMDEYGISRKHPMLPESYQPEHHALVDARWTRDAWRAVQQIVSARELA